MSSHSHSLFQAILARLSFGAVPVDGVHWSDPREVKAPEPRPSDEVPQVDWSPVGVSLSRHFRRAQRK
jgi:hypothetical protein